MEDIDITKMPYVEYLERALRDIASRNVDAMCIIAKRGNGEYKVHSWRSNVKEYAEYISAISECIRTDIDAGEI